MRQSVETDEKILHYIIEKKNPAGKERPGRIQISLVKLSEETGLSVSTVHRALDRLTSAGTIVVRAPSDKRQPNVIEYIGPPSDDFDMTVAKEAEQALNDFRAFFDRLIEEHARCIKRVSPFSSIDKSIVDAMVGYKLDEKMDTGDGKRILILSPKGYDDDDSRSSNLNRQRNEKT